jgi:hypothetical protein
MASTPAPIITDAHREQFATQGFIVFPDVLPKDIMLKGCQTLVALNYLVAQWFLCRIAGYQRCHRKDGRETRGRRTLQKRNLISRIGCV